MATSAKTRTAAIASAYQLLPVIGPTEGVDLRTSPTLLPPAKARTLINWSLASPGELVVRPGYVAFSSSLGLGRIQGGARVYLNTSIPQPTSTAFTVVAWHGAVYEVTDAGVWKAAPVLTGLSTVNQVDFVSDRDLVAAFDGATHPYKSTNGSSWTRLGIAPGTSSGTASTTTNGSVSSGVFELNYTYKDRDLAQESNGSSFVATVTLSASTGALQFVVPNSTDAQVDAIVVYARNVGSGETVRRRASSGPQSAGVSSTFVITSTSWIENDEEPLDHDLPPLLAFGVVWKNRWWAASATVTNRINFTQLFQPQAWPGDFTVDIPFELGDAIKAICALGNALFIFGTTKIFIITGQTSLDFLVTPAIASQDGALGFRAVTALENGVIHGGSNGVYIFDGGTDKLLSYDLEPGWHDVIKQAVPSDLEQVALVYHQLLKELRIAVPRRYPSAARGEWVMDLNRTRTGGAPAWAATDRDIVGYILWNGPEAAAGNRQRLFSWPATTAQLFEEAVGTTANSSNMIATYEGAGLTLGPFIGRWIDLRGEYEPHQGALSVEAVVDGVSQGAQGINIGEGLAKWGPPTAWGAFTWGGTGRRQFYTDWPISAEGRTYTQRITYTGKETWRLFSYHVGLVPEPQSRSFSE